MSYSDYADKVSSEKIVLALLEPSSPRLLLWTLHTGAIYKKTVDYFVIDVKEDNTSLTEASSASLNQGEWYYDKNGTLYIRMDDDTDPTDNYVSCKYRFFFSNKPHINTHDLTSSGVDVYYDGIIKSTSAFKQELDHADQTGIALENSGSISFYNTDGTFDPIFDKLFWENKSCKIYSWNKDIALSDKLILFEGYITDKSFDEKTVKFKIKDFLYQLRTPVPLNTFSASDGDLLETDIGRPKRRLYGQVKGVRTVHLDCVKDGIEGTGTIIGTEGSTTITGSGTSFLSETSPDDVITFDFNNEQVELTIESVDSDTQLTMSSELDFAFPASDYKILPEIQYHNNNRSHYIAGHKLREPTTTTLTADQRNKIPVVLTADFFAGDTVKIGTESRVIRRITANILVLTQNLTSIPTPGTSVTKNPINAVFFNARRLFVDRDWTLTNTSTSAKLTLTATAEFNIAPIKNIPGTTAFTNTSRDVTISNGDFTGELRPRDWIQSDDATHTTWYEVLSTAYDEATDITTVKLRIAYAGGNTSGTAKKKNVTYVTDDAIVLADCAGRENGSGEWVKTASDCVKDILTDVGVTNLNTASFTEADAVCPHTMSLKIPEDYSTKKLPETKKIISLINQSCFGSLVQRSDFSVAFDVLDIKSPTDLTSIEVKDDDIIKFSVKTKTDTYKKITSKYRHFDADTYAGTDDDGSSVYEWENQLARDIIESVNEKEIDIYMYYEDDVKTMTQRYSLFHSLTQSQVNISAKLNLSTKNLNDKIALNFDRLYKRFGTADNNKKICIVNSLERNGLDTKLGCSDLGNQWNRVARVTSDTADNFSSAVSDQKLINGYVVDDDTELPGSTEEEWATNIIG